MDRKSATELQEHMMGTYYSLRVGLATIGIALPLLVLAAGHILHEVSLQGSISAYYHGETQVRFLTTRDLFVGVLLAIAACLYFYKGFSTRENVALNLAGLFALVVALLPTNLPGTDPDTVAKVHKTCAVLFFFCIAYVSIWRARDTLYLLPESKRPQYRRWYVFTGIAMIVSPLAAIWLNAMLASDTRIFWVETLGVWAFAAYWIVKTREMRESHAERRALDGELERDVVPAATSGPGGGAAVSGALGRILRGVAPASDAVEQIVPTRGPARP